MALKENTSLGLTTVPKFHNGPYIVFAVAQGRRDRLLSARTVVAYCGRRFEC